MTSGAVATALPLDTKRDLIEEADALAMPLGVYVQAIVRGLDRSERMRAARTVPVSSMDDHESTQERELE